MAICSLSSLFRSPDSFTPGRPCQNCTTRVGLSLAVGELVTRMGASFGILGCRGSASILSAKRLLVFLTTQISSVSSVPLNELKCIIHSILFMCNFFQLTFRCISEILPRRGITMKLGHRSHKTLTTVYVPPKYLLRNQKRLNFMKH